MEMRFFSSFERTFLKHLLLKIALCLIFMVAFGATAITFASSNDAVNTSKNKDRFVVNIFDGKQRFNIRAKKQSVAEALKAVGIKINPDDAVEPSLESEITQDNFNINIYRAREVIVIDGAQKRYVKTAANEAKDIAKAAGVTLTDGDIMVLKSYNNLLESGMGVAYMVKRAKTVNLDFYGKLIQAKTQADTVAEFLREQNIKIDKNKTWLSLDQNEKLVSHIKLRIVLNGEDSFTAKEEIKFTEKIIYDYDLAIGKKEIIQKGENGERTVSYVRRMQNGQEVERRVLNSVVTKEPVEQKVRLGQKFSLPEGSHTDWMRQAGISESEFGFANFIITHESRWQPFARNRDSGAYGLCQALPGGKMASAGADWESNAITQLRWCDSYARGRYGSWREAYAFWQNKHWW